MKIDIHVKNYSRQLVKRTDTYTRASVFILGAGALGSSAGEMLVRAGVERITIVDRDIIEWTNLHRQQLYTEQDVINQLPKAVAAEKRLTAINRDVDITGLSLI